MVHMYTVCISYIIHILVSVHLVSMFWLKLTRVISSRHQALSYLSSGWYSVGRLSGVRGGSPWLLTGQTNMSNVGQNRPMFLLLPGIYKVKVKVKVNTWSIALTLVLTHLLILDE